MKANRSGDVATPVRDTETTRVRVEKGDPLYFDAGGRIRTNSIRISVMTSETRAVSFTCDASDAVKLAKELLASDLETFTLTLEGETRGRGAAGVYAHLPIVMSRREYRAFANDILFSAGR